MIFGQDQIHTNQIVPLLRALWTHVCVLIILPWMCLCVFASFFLLYSHTRYMHSTSFIFIKPKPVRMESRIFHPSSFDHLTLHRYSRMFFLYVIWLLRAIICVWNIRGEQKSIVFVNVCEMISSSSIRV